VLCLCILASSRIPQYDFGRQTPHFLASCVTTEVATLFVAAARGLDDEAQPLPTPRPEIAKNLRQISSSISHASLEPVPCPMAVSHLILPLAQQSSPAQLSSLLAPLFTYRQPCRRHRLFSSSRPQHWLLYQVVAEAYMKPAPVQTLGSAGPV
jgi:hypothetical protein